MHIALHSCCLVWDVFCNAIIVCITFFVSFFIQDSCTALMGACSRGHLVVAQYLIAQGADMNSKNNVNYSGSLWCLYNLVDMWYLNFLFTICKYNFGQLLIYMRHDDNFGDDYLYLLPLSFLFFIYSVALHPLCGHAMKGA